MAFFSQHRCSSSSQSTGASSKYDEKQVLKTKFAQKFNLGIVVKTSIESKDIWEASHKSIAINWELLGEIVHGHEIVGFENLPETGPALLIYYHAAMPIDFCYVHAKTTLYKNRKIKIVADRFLFKTPGMVMRVTNSNYMRTFFATTTVCLSALFSITLRSVIAARSIRSHSRLTRLVCFSS